MNHEAVMNRMDWSELAPELERDGSLRDFYVLSTTIHDWQSVLDAVRDLDPGPTYSSDGIPTVLPASVSEIFANRPTASPLLSLELDHVVFNCHFFGLDEARPPLSGPA